MYYINKNHTNAYIYIYIYTRIKFIAELYKAEHSKKKFNNTYCNQLEKIYKE